MEERFTLSEKNVNSGKILVSISNNFGCTCTSESTNNELRKRFEVALGNSHNTKIPNMYVLFRKLKTGNKSDSCIQDPESHIYINLIHES